MVGATAPTNYTFEGTLESETDNTIVLTGGSGLNSSAGGDEVKLVELVSVGSLATPSKVQAYLDTRGCSEDAHPTVAGGPNPVTDLDEVLSGRTSARHKFDMQKSGTYIVCYKVRGGSFERVGELFEITAVGPTNYTQSESRAGWAVNLTFVGQGLDTRSGKDSVKVVTGSECASSDPLNEHSNLALKTVPATDLESTASDDGHTTESYTTFTFPKASTYTVCYRLAGKEYVKMTPPLVILAVNPTRYYTEPDESPRLTSPSKYTFIVNTTSQGLDLTSAGDKAKVVFGTNCTEDPVADGNSMVTDLGPSDAVDATSASFGVEFITAGEYTVYVRPSMRRPAPPTAGAATRGRRAPASRRRWRRPSPRECQHPKDEKRVQANLELFRKHRTRLVAALNMLDSVSKDFDERSEEEGSECHLPTGDTTEPETDLDETEDEGSDLEHEYEAEDSSRAKDHHP